MNNSRLDRFFIPITNFTSTDITSESVSIPSGAAGTIVDFYLTNKPILNSTKNWLGGDGNTSLALTSTAFTNEVAFETPDDQLNNGDFWIDYLTGRGRGKKASTATSGTANYSVFSAATSITPGSAFTATDSTFFIQDNLDNTKKIQIQISGITTGTTRTYIAPDKNGTLALLSDVPTVDTQTFTSNGTWTKPATGTFARIICIGGGAGGGSGRRGGGGFTDQTGGGGGGGGAYSEVTIPLALLGATESVVVGDGGAGGAAQTSDNTDGNVGDNAGNSSFGNWVRAYGGIAGSGGTLGFNVNGGEGGIVGLWAGGNGVGGNNNTPSNLTTTNIGAGGGGGGGGINSLNSSFDGGLSGAVLVINHSYTLGGVVPGGVGANGAAKGNPLPGIGGGGGAAGDSMTAGGAGGNGGNYGAGGGGGGASFNGQNSGAGGNGAKGVVIVYVF